MRTLLPLVIALFASAAAAQRYQPVRYTLPAPVFAGDDGETQVQADMGIDVERDRPARWRLAEHRRLDRALSAVRPQRAGSVDAFVIVAALDSDPVFGREAREAARVLARRYHADGHVILLAGSDGTRDSDLPMGSPGNLDLALARVAEVMDPAEDVLILYTTSHGAPFGLYYNDGDQGYGAVSPSRLWSQLSTLGIRNRLILLSACYSGVFVPMLSSDTTAIVTAAASDRPSFGCQADNDWTFFGDALINTALRKPQPLAAAVDQAQSLIAGWEKAAALDPSRPQVAIGAGAGRWLDALERDLPPTTTPVGRPAITLLQVK
ncbi:C13 family peptidase [uncultured Sphingomonas sp.]|uniref:C13 family peptidase n=1 Tax=uncultured Sphingomonas sp. TaxID=158754 RepID=UPI00260EB20F|nr:C13 family peptidase [uncultured Sphingomonas sp.]